MSANGRGNMRPQSRSPPFLLTGLVVALVILGANYWNLSSSNASLSAEVADLQDQIRILSSKKINSERKNDNAMLRIRDIEKNVNDREQELSKLKTELKEVATAKESCTSKLRQNEDNVNGLKQELDTYKDKMQKMAAQPEADSSNCDKVCTDKKRELLSLLEKLGHTAVLQDLSKHGVDILDFKDMISSRQGSQEQDKGQQPQPNQAQQQQAQTKQPPQQQQSQQGQQQPQQQQSQQGQQQPQPGQQPTHGAQQNNQTQSAGSLGRTTTLTPGTNQTTTKKLRRPATGSIMNVQFGGGSKTNQKPETAYSLKNNSQSIPAKGGDDVKSRITQNKTQSGLDSVGKIVDKDDFVVEGIRKVLSPNAKVRLMNKAGEGVVEMTEKEKAAHGGQQQGVEDKNKNTQNSGKVPPGEVDEYDENIDDKANDNNPKKDQLQPPKNAEQDRKKGNKESRQ
ncbi:uncharacterized protein LOC111129907 isoform X2 [Crassostrea virginica]